jgi:integrase
MSRGHAGRITLAPGIYQDASSITGRVTVGKLPPREEYWPLGTPLRTIKAWQDVTRGELRKLQPLATRGRWEVDVLRYLARKKPTFTNPRSYLERVRDIHEWDALFRGRQRDRITIEEVNGQLYDWRAEGLSASTVNHRLDAISNLFVVLDGKRHALVGAVRFTRPEQEPRWIDRARIVRVLDAFNPGKVRARLRLLHWTGMRPSQLARLTVESFSLGSDLPYVLIGSGKGGNPTATYLVPEGLAAAREFLAADAWCRVQEDRSTKDWCTSANRMIAEACARLELAPFTVYQIRHSFLRALREGGTDLADVQVFAGHTDARTTKIYAPVVEPKLVAAVMRLSSAPPAAPEAPAVEVVSRWVSRKRG